MSPLISVFWPHLPTLVSYLYLIALLSKSPFDEPPYLPHWGDVLYGWSLRIITENVSFWFGNMTKENPQTDFFNRHLEKLCTSLKNMKIYEKMFMKWNNKTFRLQTAAYQDRGKKSRNF